MNLGQHILQAHGGEPTARCPFCRAHLPDLPWEAPPLAVGPPDAPRRGRRAHRKRRGRKDGGLDVRRA